MPTETTAEAELDRAKEIAEALRRDWGFDMRHTRGISWLRRVIAELKDEAINGR